MINSITSQSAFIRAYQPATATRDGARISPQTAQQAAQQPAQNPQFKPASDSAPGDKTSSASDAGRGAAPANQPTQLTPDQQKIVDQLQKRDAEVRTHEAAHQSAGGGSVGGASYSYQTGPDGRAYAIGGEVSVSVSTSSTNPQDAVAQLRQVEAAALAPADPSGQDLAVAASAARKIAEVERRASERPKDGSQSDRSPQPDATTRNRAAQGYALGNATAAPEPVGGQLTVSA